MKAKIDRESMRIIESIYNKHLRILRDGDELRRSIIMNRVPIHNMDDNGVLGRHKVVLEGVELYCNLMGIKLEYKQPYKNPNFFDFVFVLP